MVGVMSEKSEEKAYGGEVLEVKLELK